MRDVYIPDLTQRYSEGFRDVSEPEWDDAAVISAPQGGRMVLERLGTLERCVVVLKDCSLTCSLLDSDGYVIPSEQITRTYSDPEKAKAKFEKASRNSNYRLFSKYYHPAFCH